MQRFPLYSRARAIPAPVPVANAPVASAPPATVSPRQQARHRSRWQIICLALLLALSGAAAWQWHPVAAPAPSLKDIERALRSSLSKQPLPAAEALAYAKIRPSVVRVVGFNRDIDDPAGVVPDDGPPKPARPHAHRGRTTNAQPDDEGPSVGTGVVIQDNGTILTNLHVIEGAKRLKVQFHEGLISEAQVLRLDRAQDLAVIRALQIPDDLQAATLRGSADLRPGDHVMAVGFPFGIGPSASAGVVSGLGREFRTPAGGHTLQHLIQFDAAANPGNSGGPLVTEQGEVVGIVTAILNPSQARTFIGIGFAVPIENAAAAAGMPPF
jgi:serine protease DegQ